MWIGEIVRTTKDGRRLTIETTHQLYEDESGSRIILEISRDMTERRAMEKEIQYQNNLLSAVLENMHDAVVIYDNAGNLVTMNAQARNMYQLQPPADTTFSELHRGIDSFRLDGTLMPREEYASRRALKGKTIRNERYIVKVGLKSWIVEINATPIRDGQGALSAIVVTHHDITELIENQKEIEYQNKLLSAILDNIQDALFVYDAAGKVTALNTTARETYKIALTDTTTIDNVLSGYHCFSLDRTPMRREQYASVRALRGEYVRNMRIILEREGWSRIVEGQFHPDL